MRITGNWHENQINFWSYLIQFFLEWVMFQTKVVEQIKTHILCSLSVFSLLPPPKKNVQGWDNVEKCCTARQATDYNMAHAHCMLDT